MKKEREAIMETMLKEGGIMLNNKPINRKKLFTCYTPEERESIVQAYMDGMKIEDIVIKYNTSGGTITKYVKEAGCKLRNRTRGKEPTKEQKDTIVKLYLEGNSIRDVSVLTGIGAWLVKKTIIEANVMRPRVTKKNNND